MEIESVLNNLNAIKEAVTGHHELTVNASNENSLEVVSAEEFNSNISSEHKDKAKFLVSKTISFSPAAFEENAEIKEEVFAHVNEWATYFNNRGMSPIAELMTDLVKNEKARDSWYHDQSGGKFGT